MLNAYDRVDKIVLLIMVAFFIATIVFMVLFFRLPEEKRGKATRQLYWMESWQGIAAMVSGMSFAATVAFLVPN